MAAAVEILIKATNQASGPIKTITGDLGALEKQATMGQRIVGGFGTVAKGAMLGATVAAAGLGAGFAATIKDGLGLNSSIEQVNAQLLAFTKDGDQASAILEQIRQEAAKTPFEFQEMARATASLLPAAKASGMELMDLVRTAEILAASNPAEGLEGAAFSIKEALSGDFVSIVERFNLPRQRLKELRAEGVPAMEAISIAMREMGLDADLVTNMAGTMSGRMSTLKDSLDTIRAALAKPIFDVFKKALERLQPVLDANMGKLTKIATTIGEKIAGGLQRAIDWITGPGAQAFERGWGLLRDSFTTFQQALSGEWVDSDVIHPLHRVVGVVGQVVAAFQDNGLQGAIDVIAPYIRTAFDNVVSHVQGQLPIWAATLAEWGLRAWAWIQEAIPPLLAKLGEWGGQILGWVQANLPYWVSYLKLWADAAWVWIESAIPVVVAKLQEWGAQLLGWVSANLPGWVAQLATWGVAAWQWLQDAIPIVVAKAQEWAAQLFAWVQGQLPGWTAKLLEWGNAAWQWLADAIPPLLTKLGEWSGQLLSHLAAQLPGWIAKLLEWGTKAWQWLGEAIPPLIVKAGEFLATLIRWAASEVLPKLIEWGGRFAVALYEWVTTKLIPAIGPKLAEFAGAVITALRKMEASAKTAAAEIGRAIVDGIAGAIRSGAGAIADAARAAAQAALDAAKRALGIQSPSKAFQQVGQFMADGLVLGIERGAQEAARAAANMAAMVAQAGAVTIAPTFAPAGAGYGGSGRTWAQDLRMEPISSRGGGHVPSRAGAAQTNGGNVYNQTLNIYTSAPVEPIIQDFDLMRVMAGARS